MSDHHRTTEAAAGASWYKPPNARVVGVRDNDFYHAWGRARRDAGEARRTTLDRDLDCAIDEGGEAIMDAGDRVVLPCSAAWLAARGWNAHWADIIEVRCDTSVPLARGGMLQATWNAAREASWDAVSGVIAVNSFAMFGHPTTAKLVRLKFPILEAFEAGLFLSGSCRTR